MFIKRPGNGRRHYALIGDDGKTVYDPRIDAVNRDADAGASKDSLEARAQAILRSFRPETTELRKCNRLVVEALHRKKTQRKPDLADPAGLKQRLLRAARELGEVSVQDASEDDIYDALDGLKTPAARFEVRRGVNELLAFCRRPFRLINPRPDRPDEISFIRITQFTSLVHNLPEDYATVLGALFATGCRWSELPVVRYRDDVVEVTRQLRDASGLLGPTKNKKSRSAPLVLPLKPYVDRYRALDQATRYRLWANDSRIRRKCKRVLGIRIHDLRHSYCVEWGALGTPTTELAGYIGDTTEVTERHYRNYCPTPDAMARALGRWTTYGK